MEQVAGASVERRGPAGQAVRATVGAAGARCFGAASIRYRSVRDPRHRPCGAVFEPRALTLGDLTRQITWACKVTAAAVPMRPLGIGAGHEPLEFAFGD